MKPELRFETIQMLRGSMGIPASVPDLGGDLIFQNNLTFHLNEDDEIFEGYGTLPSAYPYRQLNTYSRKLELQDTKTAVLENNFIKAVFLPELGGRLWTLIDKKTGTNLLYTNDVIRFSNLAVRNAWFSGGVEWNIGVIGHSPLTTEQLFTAALKNENDVPVLRMYAYERIREVEYQMDFWLGEMDTLLNCRMRIVNHSKDVIPMYWWSNMAVPEYEGGRIVVPANEAYTVENWNVYKTQIPFVHGNDISLYESIPDQIDYFFDIPEENPKFIANVNKDGYGLLHVSTKRLRSRKLFSWGHNKGSDRWQAFLTKDAGRYIEIQAGLGKTQYGCIPMAPHTAWEWIEQYGAIQLSAPNSSFESLQKEATAHVYNHVSPARLETLLKETKKTALTPGKVVYKGSEYGALKNLESDFSGGRRLSEHLNFGKCTEEYSSVWADFLKTGALPKKDAASVPEDFQCSPVFYQALKEAVCKSEKDNWYAHYQLGLMYWYYGHISRAKKELITSEELQSNPWSCHALGILNHDDPAAAVNYIKHGLSMRNFDLTYVKEAFQQFLILNSGQELLDAYSELPEEIKLDSRIKYDYMSALAMTGNYQKGYDILIADENYILEDLRECETSIGTLYQNLYKGVFGTDPDSIPPQWDFDAL